MAELDQLVDDFLVSGRGRGLSPKTLREYRYPLVEIFLPYCRRHGLTEPQPVVLGGDERLARTGDGTERSRAHPPGAAPRVPWPDVSRRGPSETDTCKCIN
jgi:hypothetical protein